MLKRSKNVSLFKSLMTFPLTVGINPALSRSSDIIFRNIKVQVKYFFIGVWEIDKNRLWRVKYFSTVLNQGFQVLNSYFGAENRDDVNNFVRKIRAKIIWNILYERRFDFNSNHYQSYSNFHRKFNIFPIVIWFDQFIFFVFRVNSNRATHQDAVCVNFRNVIQLNNLVI